MNRENSSEYVDLRAILGRLLKKWPWFFLSLSITFSLALVYLLVTPKSYLVTAKLQLKDESLSDKGTGNEKFIDGLELLEGGSELEDEIGILSSNQLIEKALDELYFDVTLYSYDHQYNYLGEKIGEEVYKGPIEILLDDTSLQLIHIPIHLEFLNESDVRIDLEGEFIPVLDMVTQEIITNEDMVLDEVFKLSDGFHSEYLSFDIYVSPDHEFELGEQYYFVINNRESLIKEYSSRLSIETISKESNIVELSSQGHVPEKEIDFIDKLMAVYIDYNMQKKNQLGLKTVEFIDKQLISIYDSLMNVESNLEVFRSSNQIIDIGQTSADLTDDLQDLREEEAELKVQREYFVYILEELKRSKDIGDISSTNIGVNDPIFSDLLTELATLSKEKIDKSYSSKPNSPVIRVLEQKINNVKELLIDNTTNLIKSTDISLKDNRRRTQQLQIRIDALPQSERNLISIEREFALNDNIYNYLLQKRAEATIALASNHPDKTVIDHARKASKKPVSPKVSLILAFALIMGFAIPIGLIIGVDFMSTKITSKEELEDFFATPVMLTINHIKSKVLARSLSKNETLPVPEFRFFAMNLLNKYDLSSNPLIGFTSPLTGSGSSLCAYNLALTLAGFGKKTLYVDLDFHKRKRGYTPGLESENGILNISDYLKDNKEIEPYELFSPAENLHMIPSGKGFGSLDNMVVVHSDKIKTLLQGMKNKYDVIIIDNPSIVEHVDFNSLSRCFQVSILVVRHNFIRKQSLAKVKSLAPNQEFELIYNDLKV